MSNSPNRGIPYVPENTIDPAAGLNLSIDVIDALLQTAVISMAETEPPGTQAEGDLYIVAGEGGTATGAWAGHENDLARWVEEGDFWQFYTAGDQVAMVLNRADGRLYSFDDTVSPPSWLVVSGGGLEITDSESPQFVAADVLQIRFGAGFTLSEESDGTVVVDGGGGAAAGHGPLTALSIVSNVVTVDHSLGGDFTLSLTANVTTFTHSNLTNGDANWFSVRIAQDGTGGRTFAVPASWTYGSGVGAYVVSSGANDVDLVQGVTYDNGTTWLISYQKDFT